MPSSLTSGACTSHTLLSLQGHFQMFFSRHSPLLQSGLSPFMRLLYCSGVWSYVVNALCTPLFLVIPVIAIWFGVFPIVINWCALD